MFGFGDAGGEVVADLGDAGPLSGVAPEHGVADAGLTEMILSWDANPPPRGV